MVDTRPCESRIACSGSAVQLTLSLHNRLRNHRVYFFRGKVAVALAPRGLLARYVAAPLTAGTLELMDSLPGITKGVFQND
jgi:hypothetical protein